VPVTIASLTGVDRADAGIASGLVNTSRQIGGAIGLAAVSAIAASSTNSYLHTHRLLGASSAPALDHGFQTSLWVLTGVLVAGAALVSLLLSPPRPHPSEEEELVALDEAA
jgi:hypothetical protein